MQCRTKKCFSTFTKGECAFFAREKCGTCYLRNRLWQSGYTYILLLFIMLKVGFRYPEMSDEKIKGYVA